MLVCKVCMYVSLEYTGIKLYFSKDGLSENGIEDDGGLGVVGDLHHEAGDADHTRVCNEDRACGNRQTRVIFEPCFASHLCSCLYLPLFHSYLCGLIVVSSIAMDPINNRDTLFSRGPSPPPQAHQQFQQAMAHLVEPQGSPQGSISIRDNAPSSNTHLDSLLHSLTAPSQPSQSSPQPSHAGSVQYASVQDLPNSGPATPVSITAGSVTSTGSAPSYTTATDKQNALLSILGAVGSPAASVSSVQNITAPPPPPPPQQIPTPPGPATRAGPSTGENPGKLLLEQLMAG